MLSFFRTYQRYFFLLVTVVVVISFMFFGTYSAFEHAEVHEDWPVTSSVTGSKMMRSDVQKLSRFIEKDRSDSVVPRSGPPNLCNDGVIRNDFLKDRIADCIVAQYFNELRGDLAERLDRAKKFRPYAHPQADFISVQGMWSHFAPKLNPALDSLKAFDEPSLEMFAKLKEVYLLQSQIHPEMMRNILTHQLKQLPQLQMDERLAYGDLAVFGYHNASEWFGKNFIDLVSQFILNVSDLAYQKGYRVSLAEAKGDLIHNFQESVSRYNDKDRLSFHEHLRSLGFDEKSAAELWQKVLLFRKYFRDLGEAAFVDKMPYQGFAEYANETAIIQSYSTPISIKNAQEAEELQTYLKAISGSKHFPPKKIRSAEEVSRDYPELVETKYQAMVAEVPISQLAIQVRLKDLWDWEVQDANWKELSKKFSLEPAKTKEERFLALNRLQPALRLQIDEYARNQIVEGHPEWIKEALDRAPFEEKTWAVSGNEDPIYKKSGVYTRIKDLSILEELHILTFKQAKSALGQRIGKVKTTEFKNPFIGFCESALKGLKISDDETRFVQTEKDPITDQFKLEKKQISILRTSKEGWMKDKAFTMPSAVWSPIHVEKEDGQVIFFYLEDRKKSSMPILEQLYAGKATLAADAKAYFAERLLETVKNKNAIVIPIQKEEE